MRVEIQGKELYTETVKHDLVLSDEVFVENANHQLVKSVIKGNNILCHQMSTI